MKYVAAFAAGAAVALAVSAIDPFDYAAATAKADRFHKSQARVPQQPAAAVFDPAACISHIEISGASGLHYALRTRDGKTLYSGEHEADQTILFKDRALPSVTTRRTADSPTKLVVVNAHADSSDERKPVAN